MATQHTRQRVLFQGLCDRPLEVAFDEPRTSSDAGGVLLLPIDHQLRLCERLARSLRDERQTGKIVHSLEELLRQRIVGLACGYTDCNDVARLEHDPVHKLLLGRDPVDGERLASQPTLSRLENGVTPVELLRMSYEMAEVVFGFHRKRIGPKRIKRIVLDLDGTCDPAHGQQQGVLFNGHYDMSCYVPLLGFITFNQESEQFPFVAMLRTGKACADGAIEVLTRVVPRLRELFPRADIIVRLDGGFRAPDILETLDTLRVRYVVGYANNEVLLRAIEPTMAEVRTLAATSEGTVNRFTEVNGYRANSWRCERRIIAKAEITKLPLSQPRENPRFLVTNFNNSAEAVYDFYTGRGDSENRIKELKLGTAIDRTSCHAFTANQFRILLSTAAYILLQSLRLKARGTRLERAQAWTLREALLKIGGRVVRSVRRVTFHLAQHHAWRDVFLVVARRLGASPIAAAG